MIILITGASSGFGRLSAEALARKGHTVYASMRGTTEKNRDKVAEIAAQANRENIDLRTVELDVGSQRSVDEAVAALVAEHGRIDVVMHNAGHMVYGPAEAFTPEQLAEQYDTNVVSTQRVNRAVLPHMREVGQGLLIWNSSSSVAGGTPPFLAPYFAAKAGMDSLAISYVMDGIISSAQAAFLAQAVRERLNIVIAGGTSTGKTTLANALLDEVARTGDRVLILEDTRELQCLADDQVALRTKPGVASMAELVRSTLRLRPDRIVVGEVRGSEALDLLKAWCTGHPGGIATVHAGSAAGALARLEQLIQEAVVTVPRALIAEAVDVVVFIAGRGTSRRVREVARVTGLSADGYRLELLTPIDPQLNGDQP